MKLLCISSWHGTLDYDNLRLFTELGIDWFSTGLYLDPLHPILDHAPRKPINKAVDQDVLAEFRRLNPEHGIYKPIKLNRNIIDKFDIVLIDHCCPLGLSSLTEIWKLIKHKPVIWRTYSQQTSAIEKETQYYRKHGLKIARNSPKERTIPNYAGDDVILRGYVDENEYKGWTGEDQMVLTFNNLFAKRKLHSNTSSYLQVRARMMDTTKFELYGCDNEDAPLSIGQLTWAEQKEKYRKARVYFALGSKPASSTYNLLEAMMTGCPVVTWGKQLGNMMIVNDWKDTYEVPDIIVNGINGYCADSEYEIESYIRTLMKDLDLAKKISKSARDTAIALVGKEKVKNDWNVFLTSLL